MKLDEKGRCCGRKTIDYKSKWSTAAGPHRFCDRCNRAYDRQTGEQIENWAWTLRDDGEWVSSRRRKEVVN